MPDAAVRVVVEDSPKKVFASALDWPGWARSARTEHDALDALAAYAPRYAPVAQACSLKAPSGDRFDVVERIDGDAGTAFGVPAVTAQADRVPVARTAAARRAALVVASWAELDRIASRTPETLRKGPRGGGRDRDKMLQHVLYAEAAYGRKLGVKVREPALGDDAAIAAMRGSFADVFGQPDDGTPIVAKGWTRAYAARRIAWHALDHAWEMQDRTEQP